MELLILDNNDSFTYNIVNLIKILGVQSFEVIKSNHIEIQSLGRYDKIIISPGPGTVSDFPNLFHTIQFCEESHTPLLGICLGHQAICEFFGGKMLRMDTPIYGQKIKIKVNNTNKLFIGIPSEIEVGMYHSWKVASVTQPIQITGVSNEGVIVSICHTQHPIYGIQFHPESFMTHYGKDILLNFLNL